MFDTDSLNLSVSGKSVALKPKYPPHLETRKIYNATFFRDEQYHHEIGNHYRDFKRRPRIRRRRRNIYLRYKKSPLDIVTDPYEYRDELPMALHNFPRFALVYTPPRGRQCQCESQPPDETYNDSVRRIRAARSCEQLRALVQRYSGHIAKRVKHYRQHKSRQGKYEKNDTNRQPHTDVSDSNGSKQQAAKQRQNQQQKQQQQEKENSLEKTQSVAKACGKQKPHHSTICSDRDKTTTELYLQLASEHYEREYLAKIKYLESIPERSALKYIREKRDNNNDNNNDSQTTTTVSASCENNWNYSRLTSAKSNASNSSTNTDETTPRRRCELNFGIANLVRLIGRKRSFRIGCNDSTEYETVSGKIRNWAIRINITPAAGESTTSTERKHSRQASNTAYADSMNDFLNANTGKAIQFLETTTTFNNNNNNHNSNNRFSNGLVPSAEWSTEHLHNIIDNLTQLDLNALNTRAPETGIQQNIIPRITLTNYCDFTKNQYPNPQDFDSIDNQALNSAPSACNSTLLLKPTKFLDKANLDIPSEINYQSEARPP